MAMPFLTWSKTRTGKWWPLSATDPTLLWNVGVYVIYQIGHGTNPNVCVYVGQGVIRDRLSRRRYELDEYYHTGELVVTWAELDESLLDGVERYLADTLKPLEGERHPDVDPFS